MNRTYSADHYRRLVDRIKTRIPGVSLSTDIIAGFPTETDEDHAATIALLREIEYDGAFTFQYSPRENTKAWQMADSVPQETKTRRLNEIIEVQRHISFRKNQTEVGRTVQVLVEGESRKSVRDYCGRTDTNKMVVFPRNGEAPGQVARVLIERANAATLFGRTIGHH
jgi:tRNA-2-methylthio-N6-dimethylallyladenosine synthase